MGFHWRTVPTTVDFHYIFTEKSASIQTNILFTKQVFHIFVMYFLIETNGILEYENLFLNFSLHVDIKSSRGWIIFYYWVLGIF